MFNTLKTRIHAFLFPSEHLRMLHLEDEVKGSNDLILYMDEEIEEQRRQKIQAQLAVGFARSEVQELKMLESVRQSVIQALNKRLAQRDADAGKWKGAALELEEELKGSFFEIAELNKRLELAQSGATDGATGAATGPRLSLVA